MPNDPRTRTEPPLPPPRPSALDPLGTVNLVEHVAIPRLEVVVEREGDKPSGRKMQLDVQAQGGGVLRVGTHPSNEIVLNDPTVSRFHMRISMENQTCRVQDLGSTNGTFLQTEKSGEPVRIRDADAAPNTSIRVGQSILHVREVAPGGNDEVPAWPAFGSLLGTSLAMRRMFAVLEKIAKADCNVLIQGESGVGKELVAAEIVSHSPRRDAPFVVVDCGAISPNLVESQLFGHARGAFTGADRDRTGAFEAASGGTIFLDEIGELALDLQPKLLRVLENQEVRRLGETHARKVDVRVIAATNRDLEREVNKTRFREDLFFRLSVVTVTVPALRERKGDIELLIQHFLELLGSKQGERLFTRAVIEELAQHDWPGNVRELRNYVERAVVLESTTIRPPPASRSGEPTGELPAGGTTMNVRAIDVGTPFKIAKEALIDDFERAYLQALLAWSGGNMSRAARHAGIDRMYLHRLVQRHGLRAK
ncbi:MAG: sigma 54-interacting transcriptional regulator [Polyangiales bacterium]